MEFFLPEPLLFCWFCWHRRASSHPKLRCILFAHRYQSEIFQWQLPIPLLTKIRSGECPQQIGANVDNANRSHFFVILVRVVVEDTVRAKGGEGWKGGKIVKLMKLGKFKNAKFYISVHQNTVSCGYGTMYLLYSKTNKAKAGWLWVKRFSLISLSFYFLLSAWNPFWKIRWELNYLKLYGLTLYRLWK